MRLEMSSYKSPLELMGDVQWIHHNCAILFRDNSSQTKAAKSIVKKFQLELDDVFGCSQCYQNKEDDDTFLFPCKCRGELSHYKSPLELMGDVQWIHHNCAILFGECWETTYQSRVLKEFFPRPCRKQKLRQE